MGVYTKHILPKLIDWTCKQNPSMRQRHKIVPLAHGHVLEIGVGSGLNLPIYDQENVTRVTAIDPSVEIWNQNNVNVQGLPYEFEFKRAYADHIPASDDSFDTVVITYTLCSIPDTLSAFNEIRRVLKPHGKFIFCEHGKAPDKAILRWQNIINPVWKQFSGGCNLNRDIPLIIRESGFKIEKIDTMYIPGWKPVSYNYWGVATAL